MSDSSKKHGSSSGTDFKADLKALRQAWKRGKAVDSEAEARLVKGFVPGSASKWISLVDFETLKKAGSTDDAQEQKDKFLNVAAGDVMKPLAEEVREIATNKYLSPTLNSPKKTRKEMQAKAELLKQFSHALPEDKAYKEYLDESVRLVEFILSQTKTPPSAKFVAGFGAPKRITKFLHAAGAEDITISWTSQYLLQSVSLIEKPEKKAEAIANILFISEKNVGKLASPDCVHSPMHDAALSSFSELMAKGDTHRPVITIQTKLRNLAKKEPKDSPTHELGAKFRERVYSHNPSWKEKPKEGDKGSEGQEEAEKTKTILPETEEQPAVTETESPSEFELEDDLPHLPETEPEPQKTELPETGEATEPEKTESEPEEVLLEPEAEQEDEQPEAQDELEAEEAEDIPINPSESEEGENTELLFGLPQIREPDPLPADLPEEQAEEEAGEKSIVFGGLKLETKDQPESTISAKYDEAAPLLDEMISAESEDEARAEYTHLSNLLSPEPEDLPFEDMVLEFADLAINLIDQEFATKGVKALFSLSFTFPELSVSNSTMLIANIMRVPPEVSNPVIADKLLKGSEREVDLALALLAVRAKEGESALDSLSRSRPTHALAAEEIATTFTTKVAADILLSISNEHIQPKYLVPALEDLYAANPIHIQGLVLDVLLGRRTQQENSLFISEEKHTIQEAFLAEQFLFSLGEEAKTREATIANGLSQLKGRSAAKVAIQRMEDSTIQEDIIAWAEVLTNLEEDAVDELLLKHFSELGEATQFNAIGILTAREPSLQKAEFLFALSDQSGKVPEEAGAALAEMDFSSFNEIEEFNLLYEMRHHPTKAVEAAAGERLQIFLSENNELLSPPQAVQLSNLARSDEIPAVREYAKSVLLGSAAGMLRTEYSLKTRNFVEALEDATEISTLAIYALAKEMQKPFSEGLTEQLGEALIRFKEHSDDFSHLRILYAAKVSENQDYIEQIIIPSLASRDSISQEASTHLYELGSKGIAIAARAAKRENVPEDISQEMQKRISDKAIDVLCRANAFDEIVPMLGHENKATRLNIRNFLEQSPNTEGKTSALLTGLKSQDAQVRFASLDLLPNEDRYADEILPLVGDTSEEVSHLAAECISKLPGMAENATLSKFFLTDEIPEFIRQKVADVLLEKSENIMDIFPSEISKPEELSKILRFFQRVETLDYLYTFEKDMNDKEEGALEDALDYFCQSLAGSTLASPNPTQEKMLLLLNMCTIFNQEKVHEATRAAAEGKNADLLLQAACESEDEEVLFAASEIFFSLKDENRVVQAALAFRKLANTDLDSKLEEPYQKVLFGKDYSELSNVPSPVKDPSVDLLPYRVVKQVAFEEFVGGRGTPESAELFFNFGEQFEDIESLFDYGLDAVSELIWAGNALGSDAMAMAKTLPAHVDDSIRNETELLAKVLVLGKYGSLEKAEATSAMDHIIEHAHRRLEQVVSTPDLTETAAKNKLRLLAELLERKMIEENSLSLSSSSQNLLNTVRQEIRGSYQYLAAQLRESRGRLLSSEEVTSTQARADARKIEAKRPKASPPKRPASAKIPRGGSSEPTN